MRVTAGFRAALTVLVLAAPIMGCTDYGQTSSQLGTEVDVDVEPGDQCVFTQGYWKNHPDAWPVTSLQLGTVTYTQAELLAIFDTPVRGNGLISLAHQLIAAKLNIAAGGPSSGISATIAAADALIGGRVVPPGGSGYLDPSVTSALNNALDAYNSTELSGEGCIAAPECGDGYVEDDEQCDDGNTTSGDGCSATCRIEETPPPCCGDGYLDDGEQCDDGNVISGDGCSATCRIEETSPPCCGDGHLDAGEQCDDGNTANGDGCSSTCTVEEHCMK
jgi:cysteine-rich repeat protein